MRKTFDPLKGICWFNSILNVIRFWTISLGISFLLEPFPSWEVFSLSIPEWMMLHEIGMIEKWPSCVTRGDFSSSNWNLLLHPPQKTSYGPFVQKCVSKTATSSIVSITSKRGQNFHPLSPFTFLKTLSNCTHTYSGYQNYKITVNLFGKSLKI